MTPIAKQFAAVLGGSMLSLVLASCTVHVGGEPEQSTTTASGSVASSETTAIDPEQLLKQQCEAGISAAEGFLPSWKALATSGSIPTAEQRQALGTEIQGYADQITAQLTSIVDQTLVTRLQAVVFEMGTLVQGLADGIEVRLDSYTVAMDSVKSYCGM